MPKITTTRTAGGFYMRCQPMLHGKRPRAQSFALARCLLNACAVSARCKLTNGSKVAASGRGVCAALAERLRGARAVFTRCVRGARAMPPLLRSSSTPPMGRFCAAGSRGGQAAGARFSPPGAPAARSRHFSGLPFQWPPEARSDSRCRARDRRVRSRASKPPPKSHARGPGAPARQIRYDTAHA